MGAVKEVYFAAVEERMAELVDQGMDEKAAYEKASDEAHSIVTNRLADRTDYLRKAAREQF